MLFSITMPTYPEHKEYPFNGLINSINNKYVIEIFILYIWFTYNTKVLELKLVNQT